MCFALIIPFILIIYGFALFSTPDLVPSSRFSNKSDSKNQQQNFDE